MKLLSIKTPNGLAIAARLLEGIVVLEEARAKLGFRDATPRSVEEFLQQPAAANSLRSLLETLAKNREALAQLARQEETVRFALPFVPRNIICVGLNYRSHVEEAGRELPTQPVFFAKWTNCLIPAGEQIVLTGTSREVDYEAELAVVIGRRCRSVSAAEALDYVAGYTCLNDVSARDFQRQDKQWTRAKSQDTFGPMGPYLVTRDEIPDPQNLSIRCLVNGQPLQDSNTKMMIFPIAKLIEFVSEGITLEPGDVISTGTPEGVGFARKPPRFLREGDHVVVEIERIGSLSNPVRNRRQNK